MPYRGFSFFPEDHSYEEVEKFCLSKGYKVDRDAKNDHEYPEHFRNEGDRLIFTINKFIKVCAPWSENQPESDISVSNIFGDVRQREIRLFLAIKRDGDTSKQAEYDEVKKEYDALKKDVSKVYTVLRKKFMFPDDQLHQRRAEIIASRRERGLDALGQPLKKGLLGKLFG